MAIAYESLCQELDGLFLEIQRNIQKHIESKLAIENSMNEGFFNIAKARYINGSATVSGMQLPTELSKPTEAIAVVIEENDNGTRTRKVMRRTSFARQLSKDGSDDGVRQRRGKPSDIDLAEFREETLQDPIRLFGVLVPQALKDGQKCFIKAVDDAAVLADIQSRLLEQMDRYSVLLKKKTQLTKK